MIWVWSQVWLAGHSCAFHADTGEMLIVAADNAPNKHKKCCLSVSAALRSCGGHHLCMAHPAYDRAEGLHWQAISPAAPHQHPTPPPPPRTTTPQSNVPAQYSMLWVTLQILVGGPMQKHIPSASTGLQYRMQVYAAIHKAVHFPPAMQGARL